MSDMSDNVETWNGGTPLREGQRVRIVGVNDVSPAVWIVDEARKNDDGSWSYSVTMERDEWDPLLEFYSPIAED